MTTSKTRKQGESLITTIPKEVAHALRITKGEELSWHPTAQGYYVTVNSSDIEEDLKIFEKVRKKNNKLLKALAAYDNS